MGTTLSYSDLKLRKKVLVASEIIPQGQKVTPSNTNVSDYFDVIATDTLMSVSDAEHMEVFELLNQNHPSASIRCSALSNGQKR